MPHGTIPQPAVARGSTGLSSSIRTPGGKGKDMLTVLGKPDGGGLGDAGEGEIRSHPDHRIAMSFVAMGLAGGHPATLDDSAMIATSFPEFFAMMTRLGATIEAWD